MRSLIERSTHSRNTTRALAMTAALLLATALASPTIAAAGVFVHPNVSILEFGTSSAGAPVSRTITLWNFSTSLLRVTGFDTPEGFSLVNISNDASFILAPRNKRRVTINMVASSPGAYSGDFWIYTNSGNRRLTLRGSIEGNNSGPMVLAIEPNADAFIKQDDPNANFGSSSSLRLRHPSTGGGRQAFLRFFVPIHQSGTVRSAVLRVRSGSRPVPQASFYNVDMGWGENTITWNNWLDGGTTFQVIRNVNSTPPWSWREIDVRDAIPPGGGSVTIGIATSAADSGMSFLSRESSTPPTLEIVIE